MSFYTDYSLRVLREKRSGKRNIALSRQFQGQEGLNNSLYFDKLRGSANKGGISAGALDSAMGEVRNDSARTVAGQYSDLYDKETQRQDKITDRENAVLLQKKQEEEAAKKQKDEAQNGFVKGAIQVAGLALAPVTGGLSAGVAGVASGFVGGGGKLGINYADYDQIMTGAQDVVKGISATTTLGEHKQIMGDMGKFMQSDIYKNMTSEQLNTLADYAESGEPEMLYNYLNTMDPNGQYSLGSSFTNWKRGL